MLVTLHLPSLSVDFILKLTSLIPDLNVETSLSIITIALYQEPVLSHILCWAVTTQSTVTSWSLWKECWLFAHRGKKKNKKKIISTSSHCYWEATLKPILWKMTGKSTSSKMNWFGTVVSTFFSPSCTLPLAAAGTTPGHSRSLGWLGVRTALRQRKYQYTSHRLLYQCRLCRHLSLKVTSLYDCLVWFHQPLWEQLYQPALHQALRKPRQAARPCSQGLTTHKTTVTYTTSPHRWAGANPKQLFKEEY